VSSEATAVSFGELRQHRPGDRVTLTVVRDGRE
jgi:hypothetical protein